MRIRYLRDLRIHLRNSRAFRFLCRRGILKGRLTSRSPPKLSYNFETGIKRKPIICEGLRVILRNLRVLCSTGRIKPKPTQNQPLIIVIHFYKLCFKIYLWVPKNINLVHWTLLKTLLRPGPWEKQWIN